MTAKRRAELLAPLPLLMLVAATAAPPPKSAVTAPDKPFWFSAVWIAKSNEPFTEDLARLPKGGASGFLWRDWITPADMPDDLKAREFEGQSHLAAAIDDTGKVTSCRTLKSSGDSRLDQIACDRLLARAKFDALFAGPARPVSQTANLIVSWKTFERTKMPVPMMVPPAPPPPGTGRSYDGWPRQNWHPTLMIESFPDLQAAMPPPLAKSAKGTTAVELTVEALSGVTQCRIMQGSGVKELDDEACRVSRALTFRYTTRCEGCYPRKIPLQFVWARKGSHIRVPLPQSSVAAESVRTQNFLAERGLKPSALDQYVQEGIPRDPADTRKVKLSQDRATLRFGAFAGKDYKDLQDRSLPNPHFIASVNIDPEGRVAGCRPTQKSGNPAIDAWTCELIRKRVHYVPATDVFGDPMQVVQSQYHNLTPVGDPVVKAPN